MVDPMANCFSYVLLYTLLLERKSESCRCCDGGITIITGGRKFGTAIFFDGNNFNDTFPYPDFCIAYPYQDHRKQPDPGWLMDIEKSKN